MNSSRIAGIVLVPAAVTALAVGTSAVPAFAAAPTDGCPSGFGLLSVSALYERGYRVPALVDDPTSGLKSFGRPGNGDGWVCGVQLGNQLTPWGDPVYDFTDNQLPA